MLLTLQTKLVLNRFMTTCMVYCHEHYSYISSPADGVHDKHQQFGGTHTGIQGQGKLRKVGQAN